MIKRISRNQMNKITLKGIIKNIQTSHSIGDVEYGKANLLVKRHDDKEDCINIKYKKLSNPYKDGDEVELTGNVRSYSYTVDDKNKVDIYVFTYFDKPENAEEIVNKVELDGAVCKVDKLRTTKDGKQCLHFIFANSIITTTKKLNSYIPCVLWGEKAKLYENMKVGTKLKLEGELHSREYVKKDANGECEIRVAYEMIVSDIAE